ncbi:GNAT family N-acetyltransferase [Paenibacillus sp. 5J-6]|uniref:GNAT family N-acetyltransferase n=1 Tax=Paenibacillus silvestris TaxID=2606219 RepID=A0A6L8V7D2_9BACL|nr:GNAT family N-acetyltransferase [Paenibacillus silvestris]MZQ86278.1 GNAT family N-acetyltransferase [Paenibacillus silvestris]
MEMHISNETNNEDKSYVVNKLIEFNMRYFPDDLKGRYQAIHLFLKSADNKTCGGLVGEIFLNFLEVKYLFVEEEFRKLGYGLKLLAEAERLARENFCDFIKLDTLSFQALDFYKKQGFEVFGTLENVGGHTHYYLKKDLAGGI